MRWIFLSKRKFTIKIEQKKTCFEYFVHKMMMVSMLASDCNSILDCIHCLDHCLHFDILSFTSHTSKMCNLHPFHIILQCMPWHADAHKILRESGLLNWNIQANWLCVCCWVNSSLWHYKMTVNHNNRTLVVAVRLRMEKCEFSNSLELTSEIWKCQKFNLRL